MWVGCVDQPTTLSLPTNVKVELDSDNLSVTLLVQYSKISMNYVYIHGQFSGKSYQLKDIISLGK
jgi:hypothetical protein